MIGSHYKFDHKGIRLDPYRILSIYGITHPAQQHAIKKLLRAGRSVKSLVQDIDEVMDSLSRWKEMIEEDGFVGPAKCECDKRIPDSRGYCTNCGFEVV